ncbi:hypothetical protein DYB26_012548 [Aphanomyces astaci]|uniref:Pentatricopeptide repeat-containing protein-mitochondrial domain-containing protein n=2 Tax=Aphanomyces astaci TaxID=112090 RepID=A0A397AJB8_APHAT|nr:hypothetical protein DYB36_002535 [Aphanomyces astaci]RHY61060.1 hypothetical protein DYB34_012365 [Aphanomyces astaci]RHZ08829.1 hypothetical protein DYB26_012548 [Aphanomyces astaci]RHZ30358.1 hypothetical protein DYB31_010165 [Aphanomyces astaci]
MLRLVSKHSVAILRNASLRASSQLMLATADDAVLGAPYMTIRAKSTLPTQSQQSTASPAAADSGSVMPGSFIYDDATSSEGTAKFPFQTAVYVVPGKHNQGKKVSEWMFTLLEQSMADGNGQLNFEDMTSLIIMLAERQYYREAMEALHFSRQNNCKPRIAAYSKVISSCYAHERFELALQVFDVMRRDGFNPSFVTYSRALSSASKANQHEMVLELFRELMHDWPDLTSELQSIACNTVLNSCARNGDYDTATWILQEMKTRGIPMSQITFNSFMICMSKAGAIADVREVLVLMEEAGTSLSANAYMCAIQSCAKWKRWDTVVTLFEMMRGEHESVFLVTIAAAMMGYVKEGKPEVTMALYKECLANNVELNPFAKQAIVTAHLHMGTYEEGLEFCEGVCIMLSEQHVKDGYRGLVYKLKVQMLIALKRVDEAIALLEATELFMDKTVNCYRPLIGHFMKARQYDMATKYSQVLFQKNQYVSASDWIQALSSSIALPDKTAYWDFRRTLEVRGPDVLASIPGELFLESSKTHQKPRGMPPRTLLSPATTVPTPPKQQLKV